MPKVNQLTPQEKAAIVDKSPLSLPNNPTQSGFSAGQIKQKLSGMVTDAEDSVLAILDQKLEEIDDGFTDTDGDVAAIDARLTTAEASIVQSQTATKVIYNVKNDEATPITIGMPVYIFSTVGNSGTLTVKKATADHTIAPIKKLLGVVKDLSIAAGALGDVLVFGELTGFDTSLLTQGQPIYLGTTPGTLTSTVPTEPNHRIIVGVCAFNDPTNGAIFVEQQLGLELGELDDVRIHNVQNLQILRYNTANLRWENSSDLPANSVDLQNHISNLSNPHQVTKSQIGLGNVTNDLQIPNSEKGTANGVATLDALGRLPLSQSPVALNDVMNIINSTIFADVASLPTPTSNLYAANSFDRPRAMVLTLFGDPSFQYMPKLYYVVFSGPPTNVYSWVDTGEFLELGKYYTDITNNTTYRGTGFVGNSTTTSDFLSILNSSILSTKADLVNGTVPLTQLPNKVQNTTVITNNRIFFDFTALTNFYGPNGSVNDQKQLVVGGNGTSSSSIDIYRLPAGTPGNVQANWILERTLSNQSPFYREERILCRATKKSYFVSGFNWGVLSPSPSFLPTDTIDANNFFEEIVVGESNFYYDSYVYRIACDQNSFNPNDQTRTFYGLPRKIVIDNIVYTGNIVQIVNNFNQFEDFTITQNGDFFAVMNFSNTNTIVIGTTIFNSSGNWETSQAGNHRITIVKKDALASGAGNAQRIVIIEKI